MKRHAVMNLDEKIRISFFELQGVSMCQVWCDNKVLCIEFDSATEAVGLANKIDLLLKKWLDKKKIQNLKKAERTKGPKNADD